MEAFLPILFAGVLGFSHAFEADHLVAVGNIVSQRQNTVLAIKDGIYWGLGHSSTILIIGIMMIIGRLAVPNVTWSFLEAAVGVMLIVLGVFRVLQMGNPRFQGHDHGEGHHHHLAYGVGLVHGLAGSGAMVLLVMSEIHGNVQSVLYLLIFGLGSVLGMLVAAGIFSLPFSRKITANAHIQMGLILLSSLLCIGYGIWVVYENLFL